MSDMTSNSNSDKKRKRDDVAEQEAVARLRVWVKNHNPSKMGKRKSYSLDEDVKKKRSVTNKKKRVMFAAIKYLMEDGLPLKDGEGNEYSLRNNCLIKRKTDGKLFAVSSSKKGLYYKEVKNIEEVDDADFVAISSTETAAEKQYKEYLQKLLSGDPEIEEMVRPKKMVMPAPELSEEDKFWRNLPEDKKIQYLSAIKDEDTSSNTEE